MDTEIVQGHGHQMSGGVHTANEKCKPFLDKLFCRDVHLSFSIEVSLLNGQPDEIDILQVLFFADFWVFLDEILYGILANSSYYSYSFVDIPVDLPQTKVEKLRSKGHIPDALFLYWTLA